MLLSNFQSTKALSFINRSLWNCSHISTTVFCIELPWRIFDLGRNELVTINYSSTNCLIAAAAAVLMQQRQEQQRTARAAPQRGCSVAASDDTWHARFRVRQLRVSVLVSCIWSSRAHRTTKANAGVITICIFICRERQKQEKTKQGSEKKKQKDRQRVTDNPTQLDTTRTAFSPTSQ